MQNLIRKEQILFENKSCMVINKSCGEDSERLAAENGFFPVHRLDRPVSGCQLLAKDRSSAAFLSGVFSKQDDAAHGSSAEKSSIKKLYWAIAEKQKDDGRFEGGILPSDGWAGLVHWINFDAKKNKSFAHDEKTKGGKKAMLRYRIFGSGDNYLFMEIELLTGRHHQIRAQLAAKGFHIKGDLKYGARRSERGGGIRLHARSIVFPNPLSPEEFISAEAPAPGPDALWDAFLENINNLAVRQTLPQENG